MTYSFTVLHAACKPDAAQGGHVILLIGYYFVFCCYTGHWWLPSHSFPLCSYVHSSGFRTVCVRRYMRIFIFLVSSITGIVFILDGQYDQGSVRSCRCPSFVHFTIDHLTTLCGYIFSYIYFVYAAQKAKRRHAHTREHTNVTGSHRNHVL